MEYVENIGILEAESSHLNLTTYCVCVSLYEVWTQCLTHRCSINVHFLHFFSWNYRRSQIVEVLSGTTWLVKLKEQISLPAEWNGTFVHLPLQVDYSPPHSKPGAKDILRVIPMCSIMLDEMRRRLEAVYILIPIHILSALGLSH